MNEMRKLMEALDRAVEFDESPEDVKGHPDGRDDSLEWVGTMAQHQKTQKRSFSMEELKNIFDEAAEYASADQAIRTFEKHPQGYYLELNRTRNDDPNASPDQLTLPFTKQDLNTTIEQVNRYTGREFFIKKFRQAPRYRENSVSLAIIDDSKSHGKT